MKNSFVLLGILTIVLVAIAFIFFNSGITKIKLNESESKLLQTTPENTQKVIIGYKNGNYYPQTVTVKAGQPVELSLDKSVGGCYRSFTINQLGIKKYLATSFDTLKFTPNQKGNYKFACSMGMGTGTLIVE